MNLSQKLASKKLAIAGLAMLLPACVTINIYFPAAAAEKAADKIIDEVWQIKKQDGKKGETKPVTPAPVPQTAP
jgi:hypothetical protein